MACGCGAGHIYICAMRVAQTRCVCGGWGVIWHHASPACCVLSSTSHIAQSHSRRWHQLLHRACSRTPPSWMAEASYGDTGVQDACTGVPDLVGLGSELSS